MTGISRGEDYRIELVGDDGPVKTIQPNDMNFNPEQSRERQERCGSREQPVRQTFSGWSGDATFEEEDFTADDLMDAQESAYYNGEPVPEFEIYHTKYVPKLGATRTYRYYGVKFHWSGSTTGQKEANENTLEWDAKGRKQV